MRHRSLAQRLSFCGRWLRDVELRHPYNPHVPRDDRAQRVVTRRRFEGTCGGRAAPALDIAELTIQIRVSILAQTFEQLTVGRAGVLRADAERSAGSRRRNWEPV